MLKFSPCGARRILGILDGTGLKVKKLFHMNLLALAVIMVYIAMKIRRFVECMGVLPFFFFLVLLYYLKYIDNTYVNTTLKIMLVIVINFIIITYSSTILLL